MHLDDGRDTFKTAGEYQTAGEYWRVRERKTVTIQRFWRGFSARRYRVDVVSPTHCDNNHRISLRPKIEYRHAELVLLSAVGAERIFLLFLFF